MLGAVGIFQNKNDGTTLSNDTASDALVLEIEDNFLLFAFQANLYCSLVGLFFPRLKIITRSNSSPVGWSKNKIKRIFWMTRATTYN